MFGAEKWADAFDDMYHDNMKWYRHEMEGWVQGIYTRDGEGAKLYGAAVVAGVGDALLDFVQGSGAGLVDVLRVGEGVKQAGSVVAPDYLRFDYTAYQPLTDEQRMQLEDRVNQLVRDNHLVPGA